MSARALSKIDEVMRRRVEEGQMVGGSVLVSRRDSVVYFKQFGLMGDETTVIILEQTLPYDDRAWVALHPIVQEAINRQSALQEEPTQ